MKEYTYNLIEGHIIFEADERTVLLDTGAPFSTNKIKNRTPFEIRLSL